MKGVKKLRVAIIGAGVSGLACAHELERHGVKPDIYEQRPRSGDLVEHVGVLLQVMNRPVKDQIEEIKESCHISIKPLNLVNKVTMYAPRASGSICGKLGYLIKRGQGVDAVENQLFSLVKTPVRYNFRADCAALARKYDYVIVASGTYDITKILGCWEDVYKTWLMGATVLGSFETDEIKMWLNTEYAKSGYAYLTPFNHESASLILVVSNANRKNIVDYWKKFWQIENFTFKISSLWDWEHVSGFVYPHQVGNILFAGNAGGFMEPVLGFALFDAIRSGVYAARSIVEGGKYEDYLARLKENIWASIKLRKVLNRFTNKDYDHLIAILTAPGIKQFVYNTNLDIIKHLAGIL
ncbi:NAD(P)-binding protein [Pelotomaculum isophthalicicum JI]|uniref:NAD(P)-binding protein n=1 Tax=Pelotomaculum isophthalicicum JI TaxID=947010 RepID=A0A9X4H2V6_9FIRM|nr:NAD(P)-binding protein [Pelotomaculum isophthalicicum JI]